VFGEIITLARRLLKTNVTASSSDDSATTRSTEVTGFVLLKGSASGFKSSESSGESKILVTPVGGVGGLALGNSSVAKSRLAFGNVRVGRLGVRIMVVGVNSKGGRRNNEADPDSEWPWGVVRGEDVF